MPLRPAHSYSVGVCLQVVPLYLMGSIALWNEGIQQELAEFYISNVMLQESCPDICGVWVFPIISGVALG